MSLIDWHLVDVIELEVARRLHYGDLRLSLSTIDTLGILHSKVGAPGPSCLLWEAAQRFDLGLVPKLLNHPFFQRYPILAG